MSVSTVVCVEVMTVCWTENNQLINQSVSTVVCVEVINGLLDLKQSINQSICEYHCMCGGEGRGSTTIVIIIIIMNKFSIALFPPKNRAQRTYFQMYNR